MIQIFSGDLFVGEILFSARAVKEALVHCRVYPSKSINELLDLFPSEAPFYARDVISLIERVEQEVGECLPLMGSDYFCIHNRKKVVGMLRNIPISGRLYFYRDHPGHCLLRTIDDGSGNEYIDLRRSGKIVCDDGATIESAPKKVKDGGLPEFIKNVKSVMAKSSEGLLHMRTK
jgi:hypothetical protein